MSKVEFKWFTILEHEKEERYLRAMHNLGWEFVKVVFPGFYYFTECEPEDVVYQLDYNKDRMNGMREYIRMFEDCGWDYIMDFVGYSYFRKKVADMNGEEEIFPDRYLQGHRHRAGGAWTRAEADRILQYSGESADQCDLQLSHASLFHALGVCIPEDP